MAIEIANALFIYNVRSWTKSITSPLFTETLYYNESYGGSLKQYNGNISAMAWKHNTETNTRGYAFTYDNLSRLIKAGYLINGTVQAYNASTPTNPVYQTAYSYDKHGNMKTLQRYGKIDAAKYGLIDNLTMTYTGNQMTRVDDAAVAISLVESMDFKNGSNVANEYTYNANGAMNKDLNKGITEIQYNSLNLPRMMIMNSSSVKAKNYYTYSASGVKLRTEQRYDPNYTVTPSNATNPTNDGLTDYKNTDYAGNIIYEMGKSGTTLTNKVRILVDGGYIEAGVYYYYLTDHLGNNRVVANASGTAIQRNHYYPFGTAFTENTVAEQGKQPYKYNGKELDQMHGLNMYDYSARYYESAIGRFISVDPHAEKYYSHSPYAYVGNNPISRIDPTGMDWFVNNKTREILFLKGVSNITDEHRNTYKLGNANYENLGTDNMFGDKVTFAYEKEYEYRKFATFLTDNILDNNIFKFDLKNSNQFMKERGFSQAERVQVGEDMITHYDRDERGKLTSFTTFSIHQKGESQLTYAKPDILNSKSNLRVTSYGDKYTNWMEGTSVSYNLIKPQSQPLSKTAYFEEQRKVENINIGISIFSTIIDFILSIKK